MMSPRFVRKFALDMVYVPYGRNVISERRSASAHKIKLDVDHVCGAPDRSVKQFCQRHVPANKNRCDNSERKMEEVYGRKTRGAKDEARKGVTPRGERRGIVGRLLTSMHLLTCSNGLRFFLH